MNPLISALVSCAVLVIAVLTPSRELVAAFAALFDRGRFVSHPLQHLEQLCVLLPAGEGRDLLGGGLGGLREPEDFRQLLVEVGQFCHWISEFGVLTGVQ
jgi:hypothetical protein